MSDIVVDDPVTRNDLETQQDFDAAQETDRNHAGDPIIRQRAKTVVSMCLTEVQGFYGQKLSEWSRMDGLYNLQSLSESADDVGVHLGTPFAGVEEFATKVKSTIFTGRDFVSGEPEDRAQGENADLSVALVQEQLRTELNLEVGAMPALRAAGIYGASIQKCVPGTEVIRKRTRRREARKLGDGTVVYDFHEPEEIEHTVTQYRRYPVAPQDFRIPPTATGIDEASWCGEYSYPHEHEIRSLVDRGQYDPQAVDELLHRHEDKVTEQSRRNTRGFVTSKRTNDGDKADAGPHLQQLARFEWWGLFDMNGDGDVRECVVTMLMPSNGADSGDHRHTEGQVVQVRYNPYDHQLKPYAAFRPLERDNQFWTMGPCEVLSKNSHYEDEMATVSMLTAYHEMSPLMEIGEASGVDPQDLDGFLPGSYYEADVTGEVGYVAPPSRSGTGLQAAEYFSGKAASNMGLGQPENAPRVAAAGILTDAQQLDMRLTAWVEAFENHIIARLASLCHGFNRQYMTVERRVKTLGIQGIKGEDVRTISPVDLDIDIRFEAVVGRRLKLESMQVQGLMNMLDRMMAANMYSLQTGKGEVFDVQYTIRKIMETGFQLADDKVYVAGADPADLPSPGEEHYAFSMGERPEIRKGENYVVHLQQHLQFLQSGGAANWRPEDRQALVDHIYSTIERVSREAMNVHPTMTQMLQEMMGQVEDQSSRPSVGGGGGFSATPAGGAGSPSFRNPMPSPQNAAGMSFAPNGGAQ